MTGGLRRGIAASLTLLAMTVSSTAGRPPAGVELAMTDRPGRVGRLPMRIWR
ncbi:MAG: hypothetical protein QOH05_3745 [Acetobacteraceae bacterium]|nr:hypothetical protein [Acetobacteraceae bacterium]